VHVVDLLISKLAWVCFVNFVLDIVIVYMVVFFKKKFLKKLVNVVLKEEVYECVCLKLLRDNFLRVI
jgi:hypothetical protein